MSRLAKVKKSLGYALMIMAVLTFPVMCLIALMLFASFGRDCYPPDCSEWEAWATLVEALLMPFCSSFILVVPALYLLSEKCQQFFSRYKAVVVGLLIFSLVYLIYMSHYFW